MSVILLPISFTALYRVILIICVYSVRVIFVCLCYRHWEDYPNGGPPQYQSAPLATEYERPPPYYYPGPG